MNGLPEVCHVCKALKLPHLGAYKPGYKYNSRVFTCHACASKPRVQRRLRTNNETPPEREVRFWIQQQPWIKQHPAEAEFKVNNFIYDFSIPKLGLLIELDSKRYHQNVRHHIRDAAKTKNAVDNGWTLKRIRIGPHMLLDLERIVLDQREISGL